MRTPWLVAIVCAVVLGGAWVASRLLLSDVPLPPPPPQTTSTQPVAAAPVDPPMNAAVLPRALARQRELGTLAPAVGQPEPAAQPVAKTPPPAPSEPLEPADFAPSPFQGASAELDYAEGLLGEAPPSNERLVSAFEVFKRCVELEPANQRCHRGLALARSMLGLTSEQSVAGKTLGGGAKLEERKPEQPNARSEELSRMRPAAPLK